MAADLPEKKITHLPWDIVALVRVGYRRTAAETLAAQRCISFVEALTIVDAWREENGF